MGASATASRSSATDSIRLHHHTDLEDQTDPRLRAPLRPPRVGSRHQLVSGTPDRRGSFDRLRQSRSRLGERACQSLFGHHRPPGRAASVHNRTLTGNYDRGYQNYVPGAVSADASQLTMTAYNNATNRTNVFNQTDATYPVMTAESRTRCWRAWSSEPAHGQRPQHRLLQQHSGLDCDPITNTLITTPVTLRQNATDADNHVRTTSPRHTRRIRSTCRRP